MLVHDFPKLHTDMYVLLGLLQGRLGSALLHSFFVCKVLENFLKLELPLI